MYKKYTILVFFHPSSPRVERQNATHRAAVLKALFALPPPPATRPCQPIYPESHRHISTNSFKNTQKFPQHTHEERALDLTPSPCSSSPNTEHPQSASPDTEKTRRAQNHDENAPTTIPAPQLAAAATIL